METHSNLKEYREKKKMRLIDLAERVGTTEATLSRYENGKRNMPVDVAKKIAAVLNVGWWRLYD